MLSLKAILFAFGGMTAGPAALGVVGFVWGGLVRAAPCKEATDFFSGGLFGAEMFLDEFWIWAVAGGFALGLVFGLLSTKEQ